jgi:hypothetical protein
MYHWATFSFARHKASDDCFAKVQTLLDQFVETYIGKYNRETILKGGKLDFSIPTDTTVQSLFGWFIQFIQQLPLNASKDSDLVNIRDELLSTLNQCLYLFTLDSQTTSKRSKTPSKKKTSTPKKKTPSSKKRLRLFF